MSAATAMLTVLELELEVIDRAIAWVQEQENCSAARRSVQTNLLYAAVKDLETARNRVTQ